MSYSQRMSPVDTTWLRMDRPANLMMIVAVWLLEGPVALDKVEKQIADGFLSYRRYRQKVEYTSAGVFWRDDPNFDLAHHIKHVRLPGRGDKAALERFVGELASEPLDPNHPLWTEHIVEDYDGGAALIFRGHHAMADGMALMGVERSGKGRTLAPRAATCDAQFSFAVSLLRGCCRHVPHVPATGDTAWALRGRRLLGNS